jgi:hypothetical protein
MTWFWAIWLFGGVPVSFALAEGYACYKSKQTLSAFVWQIEQTRIARLFAWAVGVLTGGLAVHFFWGGYVCFGQ